MEISSVIKSNITDSDMSMLSHSKEHRGSERLRADRRQLGVVHPPGEPEADPRPHALRRPLCTHRHVQLRPQRLLASGPCDQRPARAAVDQSYR